jgi:hypothetical protein
MEKESDGFIERVAELRTTAEEQLEGNDYFAVANQLNTLLVSDELSDSDKGVALEKLRTRLTSGAPAAEPEAVDDRDDAMADIVSQIIQLRASAGEELQGNEYFVVAQRLDTILATADPGNADTVAALQAIQARFDAAAPAPATDTDEELVISEPKGNSFSTPQPTVAHRLIKDDDGMDDMQGQTSDEQEARETLVPATEFAAVEAEPAIVEERTGFDSLTDASWRRVQQVSQSEGAVAPLMNGSATGDADLAEAETEARSVAAAAAATIVEAAPVAKVEEEPEEQVATEIEMQAPVEEQPVVERAPEAVETEAVETEVFEEEGEVIMEPASEDADASASGFKFTPQPLIMNRPVKNEGGARPKRAAKLPHLPKTRA